MTVEKPTPYSADAGSNPAWFIPDLVAQLVEQYTFNVWVAGSNPAGITKQCWLQVPVGKYTLIKRVTGKVSTRETASTNEGCFKNYTLIT